MMEIACVAAVTAIAGYILNAMGFSGVRVFLVFSTSVMTVIALGRVGEVLKMITPVTEGAAGELIGDAVRVVGIGYVGGFFSDTCRELGALGASDALSLFMRAEIALVALPYLLEIVSLAGEVL